MRIRITLAVAAVLNVAMTCGVSSSPPSQTPPLNADLKTVMDEVRQLIRGRGYQIDEFASDEVRVVTNWQVRLAAHWRDGKRTRITARASRQKEGVVVSVEVEKQVNDNAKDPMSESGASWISGGSDVDLQDMIVWRLKLKFTDWKR